MTHLCTRRRFLGTTIATGVGASLLGGIMPTSRAAESAKGLRVGIIGLDTSHSPAFTKLLNDPKAEADLGGYRVVAAYPYGSREIESSFKRIPGYIEDMKKLDVVITESIAELLDKVDVVLLETNDGRLHLEQALQVFKAGKRVFIDKPLAASLADAVAISEAAKKSNVLFFSSSSLRFIESIQKLAKDNTAGKILGATTYSPCSIEKTHPDLVWYGIHGVEMLFAIMGTGCRSVTRVHTEQTDFVTGVWEGDRIGTYRGLRGGKKDYGGTVFGEKAIISLGSYGGYRPLLVEIVKFFQTGQAPVRPEETVEMFAFMEAADESKKQGGAPVSIAAMFEKAKK
ncbi:MAG: dehydrogenase [Lentisphaerae bacterium RIFOXYA12_FULL_48_11]|nr:MAG: dehydrogenase [Lentisphaerae bacterium RIFOXYA12_FULL_48_11]